MQLLTKETDYAINSLIYLAKHNSGYTTIKSISDKENIPYHFLRKILRKLSNDKFIKTKEGKSGGVKLYSSPLQIKIIDIIKLFQGDVQLSACLFRKNICSKRNTCILRKKIKNIEKTVENGFKSITLESLINNE